MKTLLLLRHAKSSHKNADLRDPERPLKKRGKREARCIGRLLLEEGLAPEVILTSSAERARRTAELVAKEAEFSGLIRDVPELYLAEPRAYVEALRQFGGDSERVLVVGHNPGIEELLEKLTGEAQEMPTGGLAECALPIGNWSELELGIQGKLRMARHPDALDEE